MLVFLLCITVTLVYETQLVWTAYKDAISNRGRSRNGKNVLNYSPIPKSKRCLISHLNQNLFCDKC